MTASLNYVAVEWIHNFKDEPVLIYFEINNKGWEVRKVEVFRDGTMQYAERERQKGSTFLGLEPIPPLSEISEKPEFDLRHITPEEFEDVWHRAVAVTPENE